MTSLPYFIGEVLSQTSWLLGVTAWCGEVLPRVEDQVMNQFCRLGRCKAIGKAEMHLVPLRELASVGIFYPFWRGVKISDMEKDVGHY